MLIDAALGSDVPPAYCERCGRVIDDKRNRNALAIRGVPAKGCGLRDCREVEAERARASHLAT
jgi:hypothetical protein